MTTNSTAKQIVYIDMDNVIVDFVTGIAKLPKVVLEQYPEVDGKRKGIDEAPGIFALMEPYPDSIDAVVTLATSEHLDVYLLSTAPWNNPSAWSDKLEWVHEHFAKPNATDKRLENFMHKRLILSHNKHRNSGEYLIDDRLANGAADFGGLHIHFGEADPDECRTGEYPTWLSVLKFFVNEGLLDASVANDFARKHDKQGE